MPASRRGNHFWLATGSLVWRELVRFYRYRSRVVGALGTPVLFWLLIGSGIGTSLRTGAGTEGMNYLEYFFPGTTILILLFTSIFCMMSVIEDRHQGFLLSVLVAPLPRSALVVGKVVGGASVAVLQALLFVLLAPAAGIPLSMLQVLLLAGVFSLIAMALAGLGFALAWRLDSIAGFHGIANLFLIPMWLLSGALFPPDGASAWVRAVMQLNPLTYATVAVRRILYGNLWGGVEGLPSLPLALSVTAGFALVTLLAASVLARESPRGPVG
jgi:ABC-2 type transport system permease protein